MSYERFFPPTVTLIKVPNYVIRLVSTSLNYVGYQYIQYIAYMIATSSGISKVFFFLP